MNRKGLLTSVICLFVLIILGIILIYQYYHPEARPKTDRELCEELDLEYLSTSRNIFSSNVITCYDPITKQTKEIKR